MSVRHALVALAMATVATGVATPTASAQAAVIYVNNTVAGCTDSGPGSQATPFCSVTVTNPRQPGFVTVHYPGTQRPASSTLNFAAGQTVPNLAIAMVSNGLNGVAPEPVYNGSSGDIDVIIDVTGYFSA